MEIYDGFVPRDNPHCDAIVIGSFRNHARIILWRLYPATLFVERPPFSRFMLISSIHRILLRSYRVLERPPAACPRPPRPPPSPFCAHYNAPIVAIHALSKREIRSFQGFPSIDLIRDNKKSRWKKKDPLTIFRRDFVRMIFRSLLNFLEFI